MGGGDLDAVDAVVVGSGPNGLVAANLLADAGWQVTVLEAQPEPGGAVRSGQLAAPGFIADRFSSFYPLGVASPVLRGLALERHGLRWVHAPQVLAHPMLDGRTAVLGRDLDVTAASLAGFDPRDDLAWRRLAGEWAWLGPRVIDTVMAPFPPVRAGVALAGRLGIRDGARFARFGLLPARRFAQERFHGEGAGLLLAGNALHTDLGPNDPGSAFFGCLLAMLGQHVGFPVPLGGAGRLTAALLDRLTARGGSIRCGARVQRVIVEHGRATGVGVAGGDTVRARRAVLAAVSAPSLYGDLLTPDLLPGRLRADVDRFDWDDATVKVDWALSGRIPWRNPEVAWAGTVHLGGAQEDLATFAHELAIGRIPAEPFLILGQMSTADPTRSPAGTEAAWAYTHVPARPGGAAGWADPELRSRTLQRIEARVEQFAPGFRHLVTGRHVAFPDDLEAADANLACGALGGGTAGLHQQVVFRPTPGAARPETHIARLYLASASAHPGGGVHGACGANAARAALRARWTGRLALAATRALVRD